MGFTILGLLVTAATAAYSALTGEGSAKKKTTLIVLALCGLLVASWAAYDADNKSKQASLQQAHQNAMLQEKLLATERQLAAANSSLDAQHKLLDYVSNAVGQLSKLNDLAGGKSYYVRVASGAMAEELRRYETLLLARFPGGKDSKLIAVRPTVSPKGYELVFGTGLTLASAEIFRRMSNPYANPPDHAEIRSED
jgi:hypothetical protein